MAGMQDWEKLESDIHSEYSFEEVSEDYRTSTLWINGTFLLLTFLEMALTLKCRIIISWTLQLRKTRENHTY